MSAGEFDIDFAIFAHAMMETRPGSFEEVSGCNARLTRARDRMLHGPATSIATGGVRVSAALYDARRPAAVARMRSVCASCGRCAQHGIKPP